jgi:hypothetical protein
MSGVRVYFINDISGVSDEIALTFREFRQEGARENGFRHLADSADLESLLRPPSARFGDQLIPVGQAILRGASGDRKEMCGHTGPILSADGRIM